MMQILGDNIDMDSPTWVNEISDKIDAARDREAVAELSIIAQALVTEIAKQQFQIQNLNTSLSLAGG